MYVRSREGEDEEEGDDSCFGDDVFNIHRGLELGTGFKETGQTGQVKLIRKHLGWKHKIRECLLKTFC